MLGAKLLPRSILPIIGCSNVGNLSNNHTFLAPNQCFSLLSLSLGCINLEHKNMEKLTNHRDSNSFEPS